MSKTNRQWESLAFGSGRRFAVPDRVWSVDADDAPPAWLPMARIEGLNLTVVAAADGVRLFRTRGDAKDVRVAVRIAAEAWTEHDWAAREPVLHVATGEPPKPSALIEVRALGVGSAAELTAPRLRELSPAWKLVYQPIVEVAPASGVGSVTGFEALAREPSEQGDRTVWRFPADVFHAARLVRPEASVALTRAVFERALGDVGGLDLPVRVSINVPIEAVQDEGLAAWLCEQAPRAAAAISLEILEDARPWTAGLLHNLARLRGAGYALVMDDFGDGAGDVKKLVGLAASAGVDFAYVKFDREWLAHLDDSSMALALEGIIQGCHALRHPARACIEGVEADLDPRLWQRLRDLRVDLLQGFHFLPGARRTPEAGFGLSAEDLRGYEAAAQR